MSYYLLLKKLSCFSIQLKHCNSLIIVSNRNQEYKKSRIQIFTSKSYFLRRIFLSPGNSLVIFTILLFCQQHFTESSVPKSFRLQNKIDIRSHSVHYEAVPINKSSFVKATKIKRNIWIENILCLFYISRRYFSDNYKTNKYLSTQEKGE